MYQPILFNYTKLQHNAVSDFVPVLFRKREEYWISQHHFASVTLDNKITIDINMFFCIVIILHTVHFY